MSHPIKNIATILAVVLIVPLFGACGTLNEYVEMARAHTLSKQYLGALDEWTRERTVYSEFSTRAKMVATLKSPEFMKEWLMEYGRIYLVESTTTEAAHPALTAAADTAEFLLYVYVPERESIDLAKPDSIWKPVLFDAGGNRYEPLEIRELRDASPMITEFYPYANPYYGKIYLLKFDGAALGINPTELPVTLVVTSVIARVELVW